MLYNNKKEKELRKELFQSPTSEYRGAPFWAWNCKLDKNMLMEQIEYLKEMGMGGFHIHSRTGMATEYLSDEFMELVKACKEKAKEEGMLCWLYDEDRWPSGAAGGLVTSDLHFRGRHIHFTPELKEGFEKDRRTFNKKVDGYMTSGGIKPKGYWLASYSIKLENGYLTEYKRLDKSGNEASEGYNVWHLYMELNNESPWYNDQTYVDTLNPKAIKRFAEVTYERYHEVLGDEFSKTIPAIFTDEPQFTFKQALAFAEQKTDLVLPYTDDFVDTYAEKFGTDFLDTIPELFWELPNGNISVARYHYHDHSSERFVEAFADTLGKWCGEHNIAFTGHMNKEPTLTSQTVSLGDVMRSYRAFHIPGIDILCDHHEFTTAKQCQSAVHQYGCDAMLSELYGVTNWDYDFKGHKVQGDWQAALGVTVRVHHLSLVSMEGEAKRDYPATINYQSPWYKEYSLIENYFARLNTVMSRGEAIVKIAVIHPIESYWLYWGPHDQTYEIREKLESDFDQFIKWMLFGLMDFDYISEALFPELTKVKEEAPIQVGKMKYDVIIVPSCITLRTSTVERLESFRKSGGRVIFMGDIPTLIDAVPSERVKKLASKCECIPFSKFDLLNALEEKRMLDIRYIESTNPDDHLQKSGRNDGARTNDLIHQLRSDGDNLWLFVCHAYNKLNHLEYPRRLFISMKGKWKVELYDALKGDIETAKFYYKDSRTWIEFDAYAQDSLLLKYLPTSDELPYFIPSLPLDLPADVELVNEPMSFTLSEPNVLLLDMAEYSLDNGEWQGEEEILRIDLNIRKSLGWNPRSAKGVVQPWVYKDKEQLEHTVKLRYKIQSEIDIEGLKLAIENPHTMKITYNGSILKSSPNGWYVDKSISTLLLPPVKKGDNELILELSLGKLTNLEAIYILGSFGVKVFGRYSMLTSLPEKIVFGDIVSQGFPFCSANITYHCKINQRVKTKVELEISRFGGHIIGVNLNGKKKGYIAFAPHRLDLGVLDKGEHELDITVFGNRYNSFGQVHLSNSEFYYFGPDSWRTSGSSWSYPYKLKPTGILSHPLLRR